MRKIKKRITDMTVMTSLLNTSPVGRLGTVSRDGWPNIKPLNFAYNDWRIYFHCALEGEKMEEIRRDPRVCFEIDLPIGFVKGNQENPCRASYLYRSIIIRGRAAIVEDPAEKQRGLDLLMAKYQPGGGYGAYPEDKLGITAVVRIEIDDISGKEDLGKDTVREQVQEALAKGAVLPLVVE